MSSSPERGGGPPATPGVEGAPRESGGDAGPLHHEAGADVPRTSAALSGGQGGLLIAHGPPPRSAGELRRLDALTLVARCQVRVEDIPALTAQGIRLIVNNRPDGEEPGQPPSAEIEAAARAAGLDYRHIPVAGGFPAAQVEAMADALEHGPVLAFCRSGTRSTFLWALARSSRGADAAALIRQAAAAGYDLRPLTPHLTR